MNLSNLSRSKAEDDKILNLKKKLKPMVNIKRNEVRATEENRQQTDSKASMEFNHGPISSQ